MLDINLNLYKSFYEVAKTENLTKASNEMFISTPAISKNIKNLEEALGEKLFYRANNGLKLTNAGKELYSYVGKGLEFIDEGAMNIVDSDNLNTAKLTIGCPSHVSSYYLMKHIKELEKDYPNIEINLRSGANGKELIKLLEDNKIDFAIDATHINLNNDNIRIEELKEIDNIFISKKPLQIHDIKELEQLKYILPFEETATYKELAECLAKKDIYIKHKKGIDVTELRVNEVKEGLGIGYVMKQAVIKELDNNELYEIKLPIELPKSKINLIYIDNKLSKASKKVINEYIKEK